VAPRNTHCLYDVGKTKALYINFYFRTFYIARTSRIFFSKCRVYRQNFQENKGHKFLHAKIYGNVSGFLFFFSNRVKAECQARREVLISLDLCTLTNISHSNTNTGCVLRDLRTKPPCPENYTLIKGLSPLSSTSGILLLY